MTQHGTAWYTVKSPLPLSLGMRACVLCARLRMRVRVQFSVVSISVDAYLSCLRITETLFDSSSCSFANTEPRAFVNRPSACLYLVRTVH